MKTPPADLDTTVLREVLDQQWGIRASDLLYVPLGFGDHHWQAVSDGQRYFVTGRDLRLDGRANDNREAVRALEATFRAVRELRVLAGLRFVVSALPNTSGVLVVGVGAFAITVYDWLEVGPTADPDGLIAAELVAQLHRASREYPVQAPREDFRIPHRSSLQDALADLAHVWHAGPYAQPARAELTAHQSDVRSALAEYDALVRAAISDTSAWCLTHGEPSGGNLVCDGRSSVYLVDWESARIAPPERDLVELWWNEKALAHYVRVSDASRLRPDLIRLYTLWYALAETSVYLLQFRAPHTADDNMAESWQNYLRFLP